MDSDGNSHRTHVLSPEPGWLPLLLVSKNTLSALERREHSPAVVRQLHRAFAFQEQPFSKGDLEKVDRRKGSGEGVPW